MATTTWNDIHRALGKFCNGVDQQDQDTNEYEGPGRDLMLAGTDLRLELAP
jgi:hypothetical protein